MMNRHQFYGVALLTGYLQYLLNDFRFFLENYVIERFEEFNPQCEIPHLVAASSDFYLSTVLKDSLQHQQHYVPFTVENASTVLDGLSEKIHQITSKQYPLKKFFILSSFVDTQVHIDDMKILDEIKAFIRRRLEDKRLYFDE